MEVHAFIATVKEISGSCNYCKLLRCFVPIQSISQAISQNVYSVPSRYLLRRRSGRRQSRKEQSLEGGGIGNWHRLGGALDLLEVYSAILGQPQKISGLNCRRAGECGHQITVSRRPEGTTACTCT